MCLQRYFTENSVCVVQTLVFSLENGVKVSYAELLFEDYCWFKSGNQ